MPWELPAGHAGRAWQILFTWCQAEKLELAGINREIHTPWEGVDPAKLKTDLYALLA